MNQFRLLGQNRFAPFFATQFLGALNDNVFRNGFLIVATFQGVLVFGFDHSVLANVAGALFILPFVLFSALAGQIADKYEKSYLMRRIKLLEVLLMGIAAVGFALGSYGLLLFVLFLMGCQSTLFGPVKYAYLPQHLDDSELIGGNALVESGTYVAIITGLMIGGLSVSLNPDSTALIGSCLVGFAALGYAASRRVPVTSAADPSLEVSFDAWRSTWRIIGYARREKSVFLSILGISWFWFFGSAMTLQMPAYTLEVLKGDEFVTTLLLAAFAVGVGIGALLCERLSGHRVELGLVPLGSLGLSLFAADLYFARPVAGLAPAGGLAGFVGDPGSVRVLFDLVMLGAFGGLYSVPLYALVQQRSERRHLSRIIAANNIVNAVFMVGASLLSIAVLGSGFSIPELFLVLAVLNALVAVYIYTLLPEFLMRFLAWILITVVYRIRPTGTENIPETGAAVLVCNHVSYMDPVILGGSIRRPLRFVMYYRIFEIPFLKFFFRNAKAIPIAPAREDAAVMNDAFDQIDAELAAGNLVCIFPEGRLTPDGEVQRFRSGIEKILERRAVPVIPVALCRLWGSWFSRRRHGGLHRVPGRLFAQVPVHIGKPVPPSAASAGTLELLVRTLRGDAR
ncbi:MAG TPA: MFS transporter [Woeseiaceae bacterium]|nr:MFS transporter [Woeseiaceae bacterium]